jgi:hypothetical protein
MAVADLMQLVWGFCESTSLAPPPVDGRTKDGKRGCFTDEEWVREWQHYHRRNARRLELRCLPCIIKRREAAGTRGQWRSDDPGQSVSDSSSDTP